MTTLKLGSLFDGIGIFPLAAQINSITPTWASEIEKSPIEITKFHFPNMTHLGDLTKINGGNIVPVDIITFGSPCQDLSTIGKREGLSGNKSNLFYEAIRIIDEMRNQTNGEYPTIAIWENVMGAFSSNDRMDFKAVLESFTKTSIPVPQSKRWANSGMVRSNKVDICWRVLDAQYWGVPQRRKRIFLVADYRKFSARKILFDTQRMQSNFKTVSSIWRNPTKRNRMHIVKARRQLQLLPFQERRMRSASKSRDYKGFTASFGRATDPFPTLLSRNVNVFSLFEKGQEENGVIRKLTPLECERLMGLPDEWTKYGFNKRIISDSARWRALGNSIVLPCAEFILSNIAKTYGIK